MRIEMRMSNLTMVMTRCVGSALGWEGWERIRAEDLAGIGQEQKVMDWKGNGWDWCELKMGWMG